MSIEREYEVWSTYKVTGVAYVRAKNAAEAVEKALDITDDDQVQFYFSEPHSETKMRARRVPKPHEERDPAAGAARASEEGS